jgi:hypothetical protein
MAKIDAGDLPGPEGADKSLELPQVEYAGIDDARAD